ncbi:conserved hypothetical protein [Verticillium alfalfae VaMs.102]|uniref:Major facilitator superfamily (MFS) profile domain-containing protein n=1 Tax=Verticillium alfalfae (strain VaMs.102 / ATCC MYA-4576 / FGSC 10136) TaxID=526221 RepID=C9SVC5_VERA1|nr:conserved hypothetical protein [Verticillium alfalfae VaMs.102]EEY22740.1 conserved hypothetical protein [Verticillium alfalfae VaMs.102]
MATMTGESAPIVPDAPSETSPLLGPEIGRVRAGSEDASSTAVATQSSDDDEHVQGKPRSANKMQVIILAVGIGIFLCAVDQLLTVATYAKIGSELQALNNTSWIATA